MSWRLDAGKTGLLVIDVQERLMPAIREGEAVAARVALAVRVAALFGLRIFHTEQAPEKLGATAAPVRAALDELGDEMLPVRTKLDISAAGCFGPDELPPTLLVAGVETHVCVRQSVWDLRERGHTVYVLADAVGSRREQDHRLALHEMREAAGARVTTLETVAWEFLGRAEGPAFKKLLGLLK